MTNESNAKCQCCGGAAKVHPTTIRNGRGEFHWNCWTCIIRAARLES